MLKIKSPKYAPVHIRGFVSIQSKSYTFSKLKINNQGFELVYCYDLFHHG